MTINNKNKLLKFLIFKIIDLQRNNNKFQNRDFK